MIRRPASKGDTLATGSIAKELQLDADDEFQDLDEPLAEAKALVNELKGKEGLANRKVEGELSRSLIRILWSNHPGLDCSKALKELHMKSESKKRKMSSDGRTGECKRARVDEAERESTLESQETEEGACSLPSFKPCFTIS